jgi:hypothetical protein
MTLVNLRLKGNQTVGPVLEPSQTRQYGLPALSQIGHDLLEDDVQVVGGFALAYPLAPG